ncbi:MAG: ABC transporter ATP-binding protein [Lachnospiraceae bacterium]|nr:ABC transporter ATP-binding protein [Lachnospiraceae bacterium]
MPSVKDITKVEDKNSSFVRLALLMKPYVGKLLICMAAVLIVNLSELLKPFVAEIVIDRFLVGHEEQHGLYSITGMGILYFLVAALGAAFSMTQVRLIARISQSILNDMRRRVFDKILHMNMKTLDSYGTGRLITRATNDVETVNEFYSDVFLNLFKDVFLLLGIVVVMLIMDARLALVAFSGIPVIAALTVSMKKVIKANFKKMKQIVGHINGFFSENMSGMRIVQAFKKEEDKLREFRELNAAYYKTTFTQVLLNSFLRPVMEIINSLIIALLVAYGYNRISGGMLEVGVLYAFTNYVKQFFNPINDLAEKYTTIEGALVSTDRIYEVLDEKGIEDMEAGSHRGQVKGVVEFKDVWFAYNGEDWVLKGVSFKVEKGQRVAFVGHTGAGKTTIINLISRYYSVNKGQILVDGVPVEEWNLEDLRRGVSTVMQDVFLFTGDVADNMDMHAELSEQRMEEALKIAAAEPFVEDMGGIHIPVSEQGLNFSTGQRQLLSFARAIAHEPAILVLDEATAHIDTNTEELVQQSIENISQGRTSIFIAHRLSTIRGCDRIFVLSGGVIAEQGNHEELLKQQGIYYGLVAAQMKDE